MRKYRLLKPLVALSALFGVCAQGFGQALLQAEIVVSEFIYADADAPTPSCHASTLVETPDGLLAAWFGGTAEGRRDVSIYTAALRDGRWETPQVVAEGIFEGKRYPCWNPVLFRRADGQIVLFYKVGPSPQIWWGLYKTSGDNGRTWSEATRLPSGYLGPIKNKPEALSDGTLLYPTSFENPRTWSAYLEHSDAAMERWWKTPVDNNGFEAIQPTILIHDDDRIQILCRTRNARRIVESWSEDGGESWSPLRRTSLPGNNSGIDGVSCGGVQVLVYNPLSGPRRNKLAVAVSADGRKWSRVAYLEKERSGEFSYPAVICGSDGTIHITYTHRRERIRYVQLRLIRTSR